MNEKMKKILPYLYVTGGFIATIVILIIIIDKVIMPLLIHDKGTIRVPNLIGKELNEAEKILTQNNLSLAKVNELNSDKIPNGTIMNQIPKEGTQVKSGRSIYLTVSKGQESVNVPYIIGQALRNARVNLKNKGLEVGNISYINSDIYGPDTVINQSQTSGKIVSFGSNIDLVVSKGAESQIKVPSLIGKRSEDVNSILLESGLTQGSISFLKHDTYLPNTVVNQSPEPGSLVSKGTSINIIVSK